MNSHSSGDTLVSQILMLENPDGHLARLADAFRAKIGQGCLIHQVSRPKELLASLARGFGYHLVVLDLGPAGDPESLREAFRGLRAKYRELPTIVASESDDVDTVNTLLAAGAADVLVLGDRLEARVETLLGRLNNLVVALRQNHTLQEENQRLFDREQERYQIFGESPEIRSLIERIRKVARVPRPVLVTGERGTGKELVARAIHTAFDDPARPIIAVNCAAFPEALLESELFGHERGSFTGANQQRPGKFELANGGSLFLDEIGYMSLAFQQKILRTVEYGLYTRVGGSQELRTTARVIAATNVDLKEKMESGEFLRDLYDRLAFEIISVPPLRKRQGDVDLLAREFLSRFMKEIPTFQGKRLSQHALKALRVYPFPGNVRELKNIIERAAYVDTTNEITPEDLGLVQSSPRREPGGTFSEQVTHLKRTLLEEALESASGNQAEAARILGLSYHQFRHHYRRFAWKKTVATTSDRASAT
ncbi:MAG: sigma-54 dependent transcriptional regulator [Deltaproteobacteria bacterium]|nr:sigma-54 dependent transcriptional regulator [Deltaproteobacteria bacterium]